MYVETIGQGPSLVLIHGWAMHGGIFTPLAQRLSDCFTLHIVDLPGHGHSRRIKAASSLDGTTDRLIRQLPGAIWLGWSLGGLLALNAAHRHPDSVRGLVLLTANPRFVVANGWPHAARQDVFATFAGQLRQNWRRTLEIFLALEVQGSNHLRDELRCLREQVFARGEPDPHTLETGLHWLETIDLRAALPTLPCPSLWIAGRRDQLVPWQAMAAAAGIAPAGRFLRIEGGGHAPFLSHGAEIADAIAGFSRSVL